MNGNTAARETPASRAAVPKRSGSLREGPDLLSSILLLPRHPRDRRSPGPGATTPECRALTGSLAVQIRKIVVPTGPGAMMPGTTIVSLLARGLERQVLRRRGGVLLAR